MKCKGLFGWIFGHNFKVCNLLYSYKSPKFTFFESIEEEEKVNSYISEKKAYLYCQRCGMKIEDK